MRRNERLPPGAVVHVPPYGRLEALLEGMFGRPAEFAVELGKINRIAKVMPRSVGHERDQLAMRWPRRASGETIHDLADRADHVDVAALGAAADIIGLPDASLFDHLCQSLRVVVDVEPVADIETLPIDRHAVASEPLDDGQRDQLFGKLIGTIIVRAVGYEDGQPIGMSPGTYEVIGGSLAGRIGRAWVVPRLLCEKALIGERAEDLVGRYVVEPELALAALSPMRQRRLEQNIGADHIGIDELGGSIDRAVDMAFRRQMHDGIGIKADEGVGNSGPVADVGATELVTAVTVNRVERGEIAGIGQFVEDEHLVRCVSDEVPDDG